MPQSGTTSDSEGYYGASYINHSTKEIVIVHRGTDELFSDVFDDDLLQLGLGRRPDQYTSAHEFVLFVKNDFSNTGGLYEGYNVSHSGHSLGAVLAELSAADFRDPAVTFDSPGSRPIIESMIEDGEILIPSGMVISSFLNHLNIKSYNAAPNLVNTTNEHVGQTIRIYSGYFPEAVGEATSPASYAFFTYDQHLILDIFSQFDPKTDEPRIQSIIENWPSGFGESGRYEKFFLSYANNPHYWNLYFKQESFSEEERENFINSKLGGVRNSDLEGVTITGGIWDDFIWGATNHRDTVEGNGGNDSILGFGGNDNFPSIYNKVCVG